MPSHKLSSPDDAIPPIARVIALVIGAGALLILGYNLIGLVRVETAKTIAPVAASPTPTPRAAPTVKPAAASAALRPVGENAHILSALAAGTGLHGADAVAGAPMAVKRILNIPGPMKYGQFAWDETDVPAGPLIITIDLAAQTLSVFRGGYEIGASAIIYGADNKPTPLGTFPITEKDADHVSNLYDAPMPYMLRLTNDGVSIHGAEVAWGNATNGCIGIPVKFAAKLFKVVKLGDRVIITNGKMMNVAGAKRR